MYVAVGLAVVLSVVGCVLGILAYNNTDFRNITVRTLKVKPETGDTVGVTVEPQAGAVLSAGFTGIDVTLPSDSTTGSTHPFSGVKIKNGTYGVSMGGQSSVGVRIDATGMSDAAIQIESGTTGKVVKNGTTVVH